MSRLSNLLRQVEQADPQLAGDLAREVKALGERRAFGLNFERHVPETVELADRPVRKGDKVCVLAPRGESPRGADHRLWKVTGFTGAAGERVAQLARRETLKSPVETTERRVEDIVVVAEFRDPIYPGLISTGKVERGGDKPFHTVINAENFYALQLLLYTHEGKVDAIYIDPPYNNREKSWKYNNNYVDTDDAYRHSKWLAFMERRLKLARRLLNPDDSVLIVTIDENEVHRLGLLLQQTFAGAKAQMVTSVINPAGAGRAFEFSRTDEYLFFVRIGGAAVLPEQRVERQRPVTWDTLRRSDIASRRGTSKGGQAQFYPIYVNRDSRQIECIGKPLAPRVPREQAPLRDGCSAVFPVRPDGTEMNWGITPDTAKTRLAEGHLRVGRHSPDAPQPFAISYLTGGIVQDIESGRVIVTGRAEDGSVIAHYLEGRTVMPTTAWNIAAHDAQRYGTEILKLMIPGRRFPFPKSLYAVEDCLRHVIADNPRAIVLDFFSGSGTTAHAVMRLNRDDSGQRRSISVTNNEVSVEEQARLNGEHLRPGDPEWEALGICEHITKPRITAAVTGRTPDGVAVVGNYKFVDEFPMADGFDENVEFFTMTYEAPRAVAHHRSFEAVAPLLWLRAGARGTRIDTPTDDFAVADAYAVLFDTDCSGEFLAALHDAADVRTVFIVTDDDRAFQMVCTELPAWVEAVRLYSSYLTNFTVNTGRE
ncbi:MAG: DNA methyltransferase [Solirubrobacteraceae bacterium]